MGALFVYILKSSLCLALFYLFYRWLLSKETFHRFNRFALLGVLLLSLIVPFCHISLKEPGEVHQTLLNLEQLLLLYSDDDAIVEVRRSPAFSWIKFTLILYLLGVVFFFFRNLYSFVRMWILLKHSEKEKLDNGIILITHHKKIAPFSWLKYIIISEDDRNESEKEIIAHELAHINKRHWLDLLLSEITILFHWFNPAAWLLKQELQNIHEYEADESVINQGVDAKQYQLLLIKKAVGSVRFNSLANSFNHSKLKKRITMMLKEKSSPWARLKYLYVLPLAAIAITAFARPEVSNKLSEISQVKVSDFSLNMEENLVNNSDSAIVKKGSYTIVGYKDESKNDKIIPDTTITTITSKKSEKVVSLKNGLKLRVEDETFPLVILDKKEITKEELEAINPETIESISVLKDKLAAGLYGDKGKNGVILISLKKEQKGIILVKDGVEVTPLIMFDDKEITKQEMDAINPETIQSISVLKDKSATELYGDKGKNGVVIVTSKKSVSENMVNDNQRYVDCVVALASNSEPKKYVWELKDFTLKELREAFQKSPYAENMVIVMSVPNSVKPEMVEALKNTLRDEKALKINKITKAGS